MKIFNCTKVRYYISDIFSITALFLVITFVEFCVQTFFILSKMPESIGGLIGRGLSESTTNLVELLAQLLLCLLVLSILCERLQKLSLVYNKVGIVLALYIGGVLKNVSTIPQVYFDQVSSLVIKSAELLLYMSLALFLIIPVVLLKNRTLSNYIKIISFGFVIGLLLLTSLDFKQLPVLSKNSDSPILVLSIDSLRPDFIEDYVIRHPESELAALRASSVEFQNIITPIAKTHPSLTSFLTGLNPENHEVRDNLFPAAFENDATLSKSKLLNHLKKMNFKKTLILDEVKFGYIKKGSVFDTVVSPSYEFIDILVTEIFKPTLYWSFFSNSFGDKIFNKAKMNFSYAQNYRTDQFLHEVIKAIESPEKNKFILAHTCSMHNPVPTTTDYLGTIQSDKNNLFTRYPNYFTISNYNDRAKLSEFKNLAKERFEQVMFELVEPLLMLLKESGKLDTMTLVLISDHGESFYGGQFGYSQSPMPYHGNPALFDEDSFKVVTLIKNAKIKPQKVKRIQSLVDIHDYLLNIVTNNNESSHEKFQVNDGPFRYFESSVVNTGLLNSELSLSRNYPKEGLFINSLGGLQITKKYVEPLIMQKTRSLVADDKHYSFVPTYYGIESVVCDIPICKSLLSEDLDLDEISQHLNSYTKLDQLNGLYPKATNRIHKTGDLEFAVTQSELLNPVMSWLLASQKLNQKGDLMSYLNFWLSIKTTHVVMPIEIENYMDQVLNRVCKYERIHKVCNHARTDLQNFKDSQVVSELNSLIGNSDQNLIRKYLFKNHSELISERKMRYKFLAQLSLENVDTLKQAIQEIESVKKSSIRVIDSHLYEVDSEWLIFLYLYSKIVKIDEIFTTEANKYILENRVEFLLLVNFILEKKLFFDNQECYRQQVYSKLLKKILGGDFKKYPEDVYNYLKNEKFCNFN